MKNLKKSFSLMLVAMFVVLAIVPSTFAATDNVSWYNSPISAYSHTNAAFYNYDFMDPNLITTATYTDHSALGTYNGTINGWVGLSLQGEYYWLLGYSSSLTRVY